MNSDDKALGSRASAETFSEIDDKAISRNQRYQPSLFASCRLRCMVSSLFASCKLRCMVSLLFASYKPRPRCHPPRLGCLSGSTDVRGVYEGAPSGPLASSGVSVPPDAPVSMVAPGDAATRCRLKWARKASRV